MSDTVTLPNTLPLSEQSHTLLNVVDRQSVRRRERDRLLAALEIVASEQWSRVQLALESYELESLRWASSHASPYDLGHVLEIAETVALLYGGDHIGVPDIAVALVASSRSARKDEIVDLVSSEFGLGVLQNREQIMNQHLLRLEQAERQGPVTHHEIDRGFERFGLLADKIAVRTDVVGRVALAALLSYMAWRFGPWYAWVFAFLAPMATTDTRRQWQFTGVDTIPRLAIPSPWPILPVLSVLATLLDLWPQAQLMATAFFLLGFVDYFGEDLQAKAIRAFGPAISRHGPDKAVIARSAQYYDRYGVRFRWVDFIVPLYVLVPLGTVVIPLTPAWPVIVFAVMFAARRLTMLTTLTMIVAFLIFGWRVDLAIAVLAPAGLALALTALHHRVPSKPVPVPWDSFLRYTPRTLLLAIRARRLVGRERPQAAFDLLATMPHRRRDPLDFLRAWCLIEIARPGEARRLAHNFQGRREFQAFIQCAAAMQLGRVHEAEQRLAAYRANNGYRSARLQPEWLLLGIKDEIRRGATMALPGAISRAVPERIGPDHLFRTLRLFRLAAQSCEALNPPLADHYASYVFLLTRTYRLGGKSLMLSGQSGDFDLADHRRPLDLEGMRCMVEMFKHELVNPMFRAGVSLTECVNRATTTCGYLFSFGQPVEGAMAFDSVADRLAGLPEFRSTALDCRVNALTALNQARHELFDREDREFWWATFSNVLTKAMRDAADGMDWQTLAELIESARLQQDPVVTDTNGRGEAAPYVRVNGSSRLECSLWQRWAARPQTYELEDAASRVLGPGTWWWSTWDAGNHMYWALVRPGKPVVGGVRSSSGEEELLEELHRALPLRSSDETDEAYVDRMLDSPLLFGPRLRERQLARRLADLLPVELRDALTSPNDDVSLAIAPAPKYGVIPWASVIVDHPGGETRLCERARIAVAPPVALLSKVTTRGIRSDVPLPVACAVVNPTGDLDNAEKILIVLPSTARVLTARDRPDAALLLDALRSVDTESTFVYVGHVGTVDGHSGAGFLVGHVSSAADVDGYLRAEQILAEGAVLPTQALLFGCGSADLQNVVNGEWTTLGPSMLWAGSTRSVMTVFPIVDTSELEISLIRAIESEPLDCALRRVQLTELGHWRNGRRRGAPARWAGHTLMGVFAGDGQLIAHKPRSAYVATGFVEFIDNAATVAAKRGSRTVAMWDLWVQAMRYGWYDEAKKWRRLILMATTITVGLVTLASARGMPRSGIPTQSVGIDTDVEQLIATVQNIVTQNHDRVIEPEHILVALLGTSSCTARLARALTGWDTRQMEVVSTILRDQWQGWNDTGQAQVTALSTQAVASIYAKFGIAEPPTKSDCWYFTDRSV
ncbi:hypothetical protein GGC64_006358 [Mycobacterium sp. OAS707]|uniref:hypothetical protein n=1 Tax=Mycobacterium sp. OAS707 TaxID=2663822 RepID=UPI00178B59E8|nr:hypothetical protein [Mycobacterium sp. OAS707]MBE1552271.1 hypothetical protein [Mycobacterium sp. OAS707]